MIFESRPFSLGNFSGPDLNPRSVPPHLEEDEAAALKIFSLITWLLADEIRERVCNLVRDLEKQVSLQELH
jgi:hypothetical protein